MKLACLAASLTLTSLCLPADSGYVGSEVCAGCHSELYRTFRKTSMGRSLVAISAEAAPEFNKPVQFLHPKTGRRYRIFRKDDEFFIEEFFLDSRKRVVYSDSRRVSFVIGSGNHAQSFLVQRFGRLYQSPVTFYTQVGHWDMAPGYDTENYVGFGRRVTVNCLFCHSGRPNPVNRAGDKFAAGKPFHELSIGCERCHGPGEQHLAQPGKAIVNPAKLDPELRDQVCEQCHLFGAARVLRPGKSLADYHPGKPLQEFVTVFGYNVEAPLEFTVTGHPEQMKRSVCRQRSHGKLWCGSCHEVHSTVPPAGRAAFYRARCLSCHQLDSCGRKPDPASAANRENNCIACHMPKRQVVESAHITFTDHRILKKPPTQEVTAPTTTELKLLLPTASAAKAVAARDLGFACTELASSTGRQEFNRLAVETLRPLSETGVADAEFWENLGGAYIDLGRFSEAQQAFDEAIKLNPKSATAYYSLGFLFQMQKDRPKAIDAYHHALEFDPEKSEALGNLAAAYFNSGKRQEAAKILERALRVEPGNLRWRQILESIVRTRGQSPAANP